MHWKEGLGLFSLGFSCGTVFAAVFLAGVKEHVSNELQKLADYLKPQGK